MPKMEKFDWCSLPILPFLGNNNNNALTFSFIRKFQDVFFMFNPVEMFHLI